VSSQPSTPGVRRVKSRALGEIVIVHTTHAAYGRHFKGVSSSDLVFTNLEVEHMRKLEPRAVQLVGLIKREFPEADIIDVCPIEGGIFDKLKDRLATYPPEKQKTLF